MKVITNEQRELLRKPLPSEAVKQHPTKTFLSTIKAVYVVERLNDVFGVGGWKTKTEVITTIGKMVVVKSVLTITGYDVEIEAFGGNDNSDLGDAYKGASTDALTKIGSYLEIGIDVFKGLGDTNEIKPMITPVNTPPSKKEDIANLCKQLGLEGSRKIDYELFVAEKTGKPLKEENFDEIINKLNLLKLKNL